MGAGENLAVHTAWTEAENRHDLTLHANYLHGDIHFHQPGSEPLVGLDAYVAMMQALYAGLEGFAVILDDQFATDDRVVCRWHARGTHSGEFFGLPATGKRLEFQGISLWEFDDGKARRGWSFPDIASVMTQLQP
jgi:steroid delta-isomerase-like uncharacterized protein